MCQREFFKWTSNTQGAEYCLEISFTSEAGVFLPGKNAEVQAFVLKSDWGKYSQIDDYSFNSSDSGFVDWNRVTGYVGDKLVWGIEPEPVSATENVIAVPSAISMALSWDEVQNATSPLPDIPNVKVEDIKPQNPTDEVMNEIKEINPMNK
ncbi:hypothetical protein P0092_12590 [Ruminiclostridium papyrosolvens DSM 2782]|uniref:hypothetical protein n=1 Tax=Ruminiclostridium papyrosolvens TaxID=29362 RepID=UPI0001B2709E|nr:hypothetical protein [Ruminiclostridium papyrosolvens]WES32597.1 hypothetical protein P0092_12590 [Ruminiclostridium papyrosolvens DSM 2782]